MPYLNFLKNKLGCLSAFEQLNLGFMEQCLLIEKPKPASRLNENLTEPLKGAYSNCFSETFALKTQFKLWGKNYHRKDTQLLSMAKHWSNLYVTE